MSEGEREALAQRSRTRARALFGMEAMAKGLETALRDAVALGPVELSSLWLILVGFILAYLLGPWLLPNP